MGNVAPDERCDIQSQEERTKSMRYFNHAGCGHVYYIMPLGGMATPAEISRWLLQEPHSVSGLLECLNRYQ